MENEYKVTPTSLPDITTEFGFVRGAGEWIPINWRHMEIASVGTPFESEKEDAPLPFYFRDDRFAYPILGSARDDFYRAGSVGGVKEKDPMFNHFFNAIAANADAVWVPGALWEELAKHKKRNSMGKFMVIHPLKDAMESGLVGWLGGTRIYTDGYHSIHDRFLSGRMFVLKRHPSVRRISDPLGLDRVIVMQTEKGKRFMLERDVSNQFR